jgi:hypothetical protein
MSRRRFANQDFEWVGVIEPERGPDRELIELSPQSRYKDAASTALHAYGDGPYTRFRIGRGRNEAGLYILTVDGEPVYAGECANLSKRWGPNGYGGISPRNCFVGGQPTNCRVNAAILRAAKAASLIELWFTGFDGPKQDRLALETTLIRALQPRWNKAKR